MKNKISDLRDHLFIQLERLSEANVDIELVHETNRATAMIQVSAAIVSTVAVENEFLRITQGDGSGFIPYHASDRKGVSHVPVKKIS